MNSYPPSNRLLLSLPPRNLKQIAPNLEFIRCEREQILLNVDASLDHVFFPNRVLSRPWQFTLMATSSRWRRLAARVAAECRPFWVPDARLPGLWYKFRVAQQGCRAPRLIMR